MKVTKRNKKQKLDQNLMSLKAVHNRGDFIMKKTITSATALLATLTLTACGSKSSDKAKSSSSVKTEKTSSSKASSSSMKSDKKASLTEFDKITTGNEKTGMGGTSEAKVKEYLGSKAEKVSSTTSNTNVSSDSKTESKSEKKTILSWTDVDSSLKGATVQVEFVNKKAVSKSFTGLTKGAKLTQAKYDKVKKGDMYDTVKKDLGTPMDETVTGSEKDLHQTLKYTVDAKNATLKFKDMKLTEKTLA